MDMLDPISPNKIIVHSDRIEKILKGEFTPPVTLGLDLSNWCNHNCLWCLYDNYKKEHPYNMSKELIEKSIKDFKEIGGLSICLSGGGEPLMNPEINFAIEKCEENNIEVSLNTNGGLLNILSISSLNYL